MFSLSNLSKHTKAVILFIFLCVGKLIADTSVYDKKFNILSPPPYGPVSQRTKILSDLKDLSWEKMQKADKHGQTLTNSLDSFEGNQVREKVLPLPSEKTLPKNKEN